MRELLDLDSPWWIVTYTKLAPKTAAFVLFDVYDSCRLWALSREMIQGILYLNLKTVLINVGNERECLTLIDAIERSYFRDLPGEWSTRGALPSLAPGSTGCSAEFRYKTLYGSYY